MSAKDKDLIAVRMEKLADSWDRGDFKNVKDAGWNNHQTFEWLWEKYTHKPLDPAEFPVNFKDIRKFEAGLQYYNQKVAKPQGFWASKFHIPTAALQNVPELKKFETQIINESSFFRDYTTESNKQVNEFLVDFKDFSLSRGSKLRTIKQIDSAGQKQLRRVQDEFDILQQKWLTSSDSRELDRLSDNMRKNREEINKFYETGSGEAFEIVNNVLKGTDVESVTTRDGKPLSNLEKTKLNKMLDNYHEIRKNGVVGLIRGLQKIKSLAKEKNLGWVDGTVDRINGLIKSIEFQHTIDENGVTIDYKHMQSERDFLSLGFKADDRYAHNGNVKFSKHYMSQYTLGILKTIKKMEDAIYNRDLTLDEKIDQEIKSWESIVDVAKNRSPILNPVYDNDPYYFLKKYTSDVGVFNYKAHVKSTFRDAVDTITREHLEVAKENKRQDLVETAESWNKLLLDVYSEIQHIDPNMDNVSHDLMRIMTSVTYFRLMGGNVRSAARNATQRLHEFVEFGLKASAPFVGDAARFYSEAGKATQNGEMVVRQQKKFGLQWFDGKSRTSNAWDSIMQKNVKVSEQSRGALEESYMKDRELYVDHNGELQIRGGEPGIRKVTAKAAHATSAIARVGGTMHKIVEDWNRSKTFKVGFALAYQNLSSTNRPWLTKKILGEKGIEKIKGIKGEDYEVTYKDLQAKHGADTGKIVDNWIENTAGQIAYNSTLDLHFEYAKWNKAKAIKASAGNRWPWAFAKVGFGQFAHYRFNMINLMYKWMKEGGLSVKAGDFRSEEAMRPLRFGMLQAFIWGATIAGRTNFRKLAPNEVMDYSDATYTWATADRNNPDDLKKLDKVTYGQGAMYFAGPNAPYAMSVYELLTHSTMGERKDERTQFAHVESVKKGVKRDKNKELYDKIAMINSQAARFIAYTWEVMKGGGGLKDALYLELGLFPSKEQKEMSKWLWGSKKKKKVFKKDISAYDREAAIKALGGI
jgi:hypothetical protein